MDLILKQWVEPHIDHSAWEFYDLSCANRDRTEDKARRPSAPPPPKHADSVSFLRCMTLCSASVPSVPQTQPTGTSSGVPVAAPKPPPSPAPLLPALGAARRGGGGSAPGVHLQRAHRHPHRDPEGEARPQEGPHPPPQSPHARRALRPGFCRSGRGLCSVAFNYFENVISRDKGEPTIHHPRRSAFTVRLGAATGIPVALVFPILSSDFPTGHSDKGHMSPPLGRAAANRRESKPLTSFGS